MIVYLAGPIDNGDRYIEEIKIEVTDKLVAAGATVFNPQGAWASNAAGFARDGYRVQELNTEALANVDLVIALVPPSIPTVGTPIEVYTALYDFNVPVALWLDGADFMGAAWAWMMESNPDRMYLMPDLYRETIDDVLTWAKDAK